MANTNAAVAILREIQATVGTMSEQTEHLQTLGHIAVSLQQPVAVVARLLAEVGASPRLILNSTSYYVERDAQRVGERLEAKGLRTKRS